MASSTNATSDEPKKKFRPTSLCSTCEEKRRIAVNFVPFVNEMDIRVPDKAEPMASGWISLKIDDTPTMLKAAILDLFHALLPDSHHKLKIKFGCAKNDIYQIMDTLPDIIFVRLILQDPCVDDDISKPRGSKRKALDEVSKAEGPKREKHEWKAPPEYVDPVTLLEESISDNLKNFVDATTLHKTAREIAMNAYFDWIDQIPYRHPGHIMITGNPGVGKTTGAWALARFLTSSGIVRREVIVEAHRDDIVDRFVGGTEEKTRNKIMPALGGVVIFDEVYALNKPGSPNDFGKEAVTTIMKFMTRENAPVFMFLGYRKEMEGFVEMNAGFQRRMRYKINLPDYKPMTLAKIAWRKMDTMGLTVKEEVKLNPYFHAMNPEYLELRNATVAVDLVDRAHTQARARSLKMPYYNRKGTSMVLTKGDFDAAAESIIKECVDSPRNEFRRNIYM